MAPQAAWAFVEVLALFGPALSFQQWQRFVILSVGWTLTTGRHAITQALVETGVSGKRHHEAFHRLFSHGSWSPDTLGHLLFCMVRRVFQPALSFVIDDSLAPKKGPHIFGIACHIDPVTSTRKHRNFRFGHCWVMLSIRLKLPFSRRTWALPLLFRLYRPPSVEKRGEIPTESKARLAREMLGVLLAWTGPERLSLAIDSAYCTRGMLRALPDNVVVEGSLKANSVLHAPPAARQQKQRGRPSSKGERLGTIAELAASNSYKWEELELSLDGKQATVRAKTFLAVWAHVCPGHVLRIVITESLNGDRRYRAFFSMEASRSAVEVLEGYSGRWSTEVTFHEGKQLLGMGQSSARRPQAVERTFPFVGLLYSTLVLWYAQYMQRSPLAAWPIRPWYRRKTDVSFEDIMRTARRTLSVCDISEMLGKLQSNGEIHSDRLRTAT